jgi:hypothetical protein
MVRQADSTDGRARQKKQTKDIPERTDAYEDARETEVQVSKVGH